MKLVPLALAALSILVVPARAEDDPVVAEAASEILRIEKLAAGMTPGDQATAKEHLAALQEVSDRLMGVEDKDAPAWVAAAQHLMALQKRIVETANRPGAPRVRLYEIHKEVVAAFNEIKAVKVSAFRDEGTVSAWRKRLADFRARLAPLKAEKDWAAVSGNVDKIAKLLELGIGASTSLPTSDPEATAGEIQATLDALLEKHATKNLPPKLSLPATEDEVRDWAAGLKSLLDEEIPADLRTIDGFKGHPNANKQRVSSARHWIGWEARRQAQARLDQGCQLIDSGAMGAVRFAEFILESDPKNESHVQNRILGERSQTGNLETLRNGLNSIELAKSLDAGLGRKAPDDRAAQSKRIESAIEHFHACVKAALHLVRMPSARSTDPELLAIAEKTLKDPKYGVNPWKRMVINFSVHQRKSTILRKEKLPRRIWEEFQVTTAEKVGDRWFLFYNRLRKFSRGDTTTPTGKWILAERFRSVEILEENIGK